MLSYSEVREFIDKVLGKTVQLKGWTNYKLTVLEGDDDGQTISGELYYDNSYLRLDTYPIHDGFNIEGDLYWSILTSDIRSDTVQPEPELPEWKVWDNISEDIKARQAELMSNLRKRRGG